MLKSRRKYPKDPSLNCNELSKYNRGERKEYLRYSAPPLWWAALDKDLEEQKRLLSIPEIDINKGNSIGETPFMQVVKRYLNLGYSEDITEESIRSMNESYGDTYGAYIYDIDNYLMTIGVDEEVRSSLIKIREQFQKREETYRKSVLLFIRDPRNTDINRVFSICMDFRLLLQNTDSWNREGNAIPTRERILLRLEEILSLFPKEAFYTSVLGRNDICEGLLQKDVNSLYNLKNVLDTIQNKQNRDRNIWFRWVEYIFDELRDSYDSIEYDVNRREKEWMWFSFGNLSWERSICMLMRSCDTRLIKACTQGDLQTVEELLSHPKIDVNKRNLETGVFPLWVASLNGYKEIVDLLLSKEDIDINQESFDQKSSLFVACENGHEPIVKLFVAHPAINAKTFKRAFAHVVSTGNESLVELFMEVMRVTAHTRDPKNRIYRQAKIKAIASLEKNPVVIQKVLSEYAQFVNRKLHGWKKNTYREFVTSRRKKQRPIGEELAYIPITQTLFEHVCEKEKDEVLPFLLDHPRIKLSDDEIYEQTFKIIQKNENRGNLYLLFLNLFSKLKERVSPGKLFHLLKSVPSRGNHNKIIRAHIEQYLVQNGLTEINKFSNLPKLPTEIQRYIVDFFQYSLEDKVAEKKADFLDTIDCEDDDQPIFKPRRKKVLPGKPVNKIIIPKAKIIKK